MIVDERKIIESDIFCKIRLSFERKKLFPSLIFESSCLELSDIFSRLVARMFFCETHSSCGKCERCRLFEEGRLSDFLEISTEGNILKLEDVSGVSSHFLLSSAYDSYRVVMIHEIEKLGISATNSLLKVVEELGDRCILIMSSKEVSRMLPTFLSRCVVFNIGTGLIDSEKLLDIYPFLSEDLIEKIETVVENSLIKEGKDNYSMIEDLYNNYSKLKFMEIYEGVHICLNRILKRYLDKGNESIDRKKLSYIMKELSDLRKDGVKSSSLNTRLGMERILL